MRTIAIVEHVREIEVVFHLFLQRRQQHRSRTRRRESSSCPAERLKAVNAPVDKSLPQR
jgi:hypothetical protein